MKMKVLLHFQGFYRYTAEKKYKFYQAVVSSVSTRVRFIKETTSFGADAEKFRSVLLWDFVLSEITIVRNLLQVSNVFNWSRKFYFYQGNVMGFEM